MWMSSHDLVRRAQVVRDVQERDIVLIPQPQHDVQDHRAQRSIDHGDRLVGHDQAGLQHKGARHHHALALAAAELVRVLFQHLLAAHTHDVQRLLDQLIGLKPAVGQIELFDDQVKDVLHPVKGIVHRIRVLKDGLHLAPVLRSFARGSFA